MQSLSLMKRRLHGSNHVDRAVGDIDLRAGRAFGSSWGVCNFDKTRLDGANFQGASFVKCRFAEGTARMTDFSMARFTGCEFREMELSQANFSATILTDVLFHRCKLDLSIFNDATLRGVVRFSCSDLHGADLSFTEAESPRFNDCNLWGAKVPWGCQIFGGHLDQRTVRFGLALLANSYRDGDDTVFVDKIRELAGESATSVVGRLMRRQDVNDEST